MPVSARNRAVLFANDFPPVTSGIATAFVNLCRRLPPGRILVIAPRMPGDRETDAGLPFPVRRIRLPTGEENVAKLLKTALTLLHALRMALVERPARFHCGQVLSSGVAGRVCRLFGVPYVTYVYGSETARMGAGITGWLMRRALDGSERIVTNSDATSAEFRAFGAPDEKLLRVYPGVDPRQFRPGPKRPDLVERFDLGGKRVLLTVARLDRRKGHDAVIRALARLRATHPDLVYLIAGRGREEPRLRALAESCGVADRVRFAGFVPDADLPAIYALCDIFAMPNRTTEGTALAGDIEGFGISFVEAGACGRPVIAGRSGGAVEAVLDGQTGLLVDPLSDGQVAEALRRLLDDPGLARRLGEAGRRRAEALFDWDLLAKQIEAIL